MVDPTNILHTFRIIRCFGHISIWSIFFFAIGYNGNVCHYQASTHPPFSAHFALQRAARAKTLAAAAPRSSSLVSPLPLEDAGGQSLSVDDGGGEVFSRSGFTTWIRLITWMHFPGRRGHGGEGWEPGWQPWEMVVALPWWMAAGVGFANRDA
jgi:hypothetical protein